jgi:hypothetical protein
MNAMSPLAFHRRRVEQLSGTLGVWRECANAACRRAGACRRSADVLPACLLPIVREVGVTIESFGAGFGTVRVREADPVAAQLARINKRIAAVLEKEIENIAEARARKARVRSVPTGEVGAATAACPATGEK